MKTIELKEDKLLILDQTKLPRKKQVLKIRSTTALIQAVKRLSVRGAPLIGVAGAYGLVIASREIKTKDFESFLKQFLLKARLVAGARPTAVNLNWAVTRILRLVFEKAVTVEAAKKIILDEAIRIHKEDKELCLGIGKAGLGLVKKGDSILTYCNAGALATGGIGTALAPLYLAKKKGIKFHVFVPETRPLLQGARLTAWELAEAGIPYTLIGDGMIGTLMAAGRIKKVITGADRIASNGDAANKIGTYSAAVLAAHHKVPFYIAAPFSTFDLNCKNGDEIPIEEREQDEVRGFGKFQWAPGKSKTYNPAFDVTPAKLIKGFITDKGIIKPPYKNSLKRVFR